MPTEVPTMAASASGLSITRRLPKVRCRSSVTRKTPPSTPTSSPMTRTSGSRSISWRRARFRAFTMFSFAIALPGGRALAAHRRRRRACLGAVGAPGAQPRGHLVALGAQVGRQVAVDVIEHGQRIGRRRGLEASDRLGDLGVHLRLEALLEEVSLL